MSQSRPFRLPKGGRLIDRAYQLPFRFDGRHLRGVQGDTLAFLQVLRSPDNGLAVDDAELEAAMEIVLAELG